MVYQNMPPTGGICEGFLACLTADLFALAAGTALFLALFVAAALANVVSAREAAADERERLLAEADALDRFVSRVADIEAGTPRAALAGDPGAMTALGSGDRGRLGRVREAYRETVMSVPHYEAEYDESLARNLRAEFGDDVAAALLEGGDLSPQLKGTVLTRGREARRRRLVVVEHIESEQASLAAARRRLGPAADSVDRLADADLSSFGDDELAAESYLLADRREDCKAAVERRQDAVQNRRGLAERVDAVDSIEGYLYGSLPVTYPVLSDTTTLLDRIEDLQGRVLAAMR